MSERIEINPAIMLGKPVIRGTRITVELVIQKLSEGMSEAEMIIAYPRLSRDDIRAALGYAMHLITHDEVLHQPVYA